MYNRVKSMVSINGHSSNVGVRQGEKLSPLLLSIYIKDVEEFFASKNVGGVTIEVNDSIKNDCMLNVSYYFMLTIQLLFQGLQKVCNMLLMSFIPILITR